MKTNERNKDGELKKQLASIIQNLSWSAEKLTLIFHQDDILHSCVSSLRTAFNEGEVNQEFRDQ